MIQDSSSSSLKSELFEIVFGTKTLAGKLFDLVILCLVILSVTNVMLESVEDIQKEYGKAILVSEIIFTILFSFEYFLRIWISPKRKQYIFSFFGLVDLMALVPSYLSLFFPGLHTLVTIRTLRLIRIFRILQLTQYSEAGAHILTALKASKAKIIVFISFVLSLAIVFGTVLYLVEGKENGFTSIPMGVYWSIVTMTTVGFGDLAPKTGLGQFISSILMIMGYGVIAVPTGVVGFELSKKKDQDKKCQYCGK